MKIRVLAGVAVLVAVVSITAVSTSFSQAQQGGAQIQQAAGLGRVVSGQQPGGQNDAYGGEERVWRDNPIHTTVLPKDDTTEQLAAIMVEWRAAIADHGHCVACHSWTKDPTKVNQFGFPDIDPYDDSKSEYKAAREMYVLTQDINKKLIASSRAPITCGSCHRGHLIPEAYVAPPLPGGAPDGQPAVPPKGQPQKP